jgi:hypothetical protein
MEVMWKVIWIARVDLGSIDDQVGIRGGSFFAESPHARRSALNTIYVEKKNIVR